MKTKRRKGLMIVLLGLDGSGKTTVKESLEESLNIIFPDIRCFYFRPGFLPFPGVLLGLRENIQTGVNPNPHGHKRENPLRSVVRFFYYLFDFIIGYRIKLRPLIKRGYLVIFDRYYFDYLVDLFRYNMSIPPWLPKIFLPTIPHPDLTIYLYASPETLYKRKQEISVDEIHRQIYEFDKLIRIVPGVFTISSEQPVGKITKQITDIILEMRGHNG